MPGETIQHRELKRLAVEWLRRLGCSAVAVEVRCPSRAGGWTWPDGSRATRVGRARRDRSSRRRRERGTGRGRTIWWSASGPVDFLRDDADQASLVRTREHLERRRAEIEEQRIKPREPHLRRGGSALFPELETWDFAASRIDSYRRVVRELRRVEKRLHGETKFGLMSRYRLADHLYLFTPSGLLRRSELPRGFGLIEASAMRLRHPMPVDPEAPLPISERVPAPALHCDPEHRVRLLRNLAVAASRTADSTPNAGG